MSYQFHVIAGPDTGRSITLQTGDALMLGRSHDAFYRINDPRVSRSHCQIKLDGDRVTVDCNGGSGGTKINGQVVKTKTIAPGDVLEVGDTKLRLAMGDFPMDVVKAAVAGASTVGPTAAAPSPDKLEALSGKTLSHYEIGPAIGKGRVGMVFQAHDTKNGRDVAIKVLLPEFSKNEEEMKRFVRGMQNAMPLRHPNLIAVYGAGKAGPHCWIAMEYVAGENMTQEIQRIGVAGMLDWKHAYRAAVHIGRALAYAHENDVVHRNVTPTNVLRDATTGTYKLGDLMLAKSLEGTASEQVTRPGELVGDVEYMAPERTRGTTDVDARSDVYGLGAITYALLTGKPPCQGKTLVEKVASIRTVEPPRPKKAQMTVPDLFDGVVMKMLAKDPAKRFQTVAEVVAELERIGKYNGVSA
ncbi:MAG: FHA domain-containing serine/threonine-protein kinase [Gemmataceae bacterium]